MANNKNKGPSIRLLQSAIKDIKSNVDTSSVKRDHDKSKHYKVKNSSQDIKSNLGVSSAKQDIDKSKDCKKEKNEKKNYAEYLLSAEMAELAKIIHEERKNRKEAKNFKVPLGRGRNNESQSSLHSQFKKKRSLPMLENCLDAFAEEESIDNGMAYNSFNWPVQNLRTQDQSPSEPFIAQKNTTSYSLNNPNDFLNVSSSKNQSNDILCPESPKMLSLPKQIANISKTIDNQAKPFCVTHQEEVMSLLRNRKYLPPPSDKNTEFRIYDSTSKIPPHFSCNEIIGTNSIHSEKKTKLKLSPYQLSPDKVSSFGLFNSEMNQAYHSSVTKDENFNLVTHSSYNKENYLPMDRNNKNKMPNDFNSQLIQSTSNEIFTDCTENQKPSPIYSEYLPVGNTYPKVSDAVFSSTNPNHSGLKFLKPGNLRMSSQHIDLTDYEEIDNLIDSYISKMPNSSEAGSKQSNTKALEKFPNRNSGSVISDLISSGSITSLTIDLNTKSKASSETKVVQNCQKNSSESSNMKISIVNSGQAINSVKIISVTGSNEINLNNFM